MGNLILSKNYRAAHPYYAAELGIHLYTIEELCYYIYNNVMLIDEGFFDDRLYKFIDEVGYEALTLKLKKWEGSVPFNERVMAILQDVHYYDDREIGLFRDEVNRISREGYDVILKEKADYLVSISRYYDAIKMYEKILSLKDFDDGVRKAKVYSGLGTAHARLFSYKQSMQYYLKAYELDDDARFLRNAYMVSKVSNSEKLPEEVLKNISETTASMWDEEFEEIKLRASQSDEVLELTALGEKDARKKRNGFLKMLMKWKADFKRCQ